MNTCQLDTSHTYQMLAEESGLQRPSMGSRKSTAEKRLEFALDTTIIKSKSSSLNSLIPTTTNIEKLRPDKLSKQQPNKKSNSIGTISRTEGEFLSPGQVSPPSIHLKRISPSTVQAQKTSLYALKRVDVPTVTKGNKISSRTQHLFQQYEKDMSKVAVEGRKALEDELQQVKSQYQQSVNDYANEQIARRAK